MSNQTQEQIDALIQFVNNAEDPGVVTNIIVATVLAYFADRIKNMATVSALNNEATARAAADSALSGQINSEATARATADSALSVRITQLQNALDSLTSEDTTEAIESFQEVINFLAEVTDDETLIGLLNTINVRINSVENNLNRKASLDGDTGKLEYSQAPTVMLDSMGYELDNADNPSPPRNHNNTSGETVFNPTSNKIVYYKTASSPVTRDPDSRLVYGNKLTGYLYQWKNGSMKQVGSNGSNVDVVNNLNSNDGTKALSAKQGKILKTNIQTLNDNINALRSALANMAFTQLPKPTMGELDWGGDKCAVTINNSLTGCSADKSGLQQVNEGTNLVITITANSGNLIRSVTSSQGTVVVAANKATATITIANVMSDMTVNIVAEATAKGSFSASISDNRVSGTGASTGITEGSAWESVLSLNNTAEEGAAITAVEVLMAGGGSISYNSATGKVSTAFVTGNITINVTVAVVGRVTISFPLKSTGVVISSNNTVINDGVSQISVAEGSAINLLIAPDTSYSLQSVSVLMGQQSITPTDNGDGTCTLAIANVTANVTISASASQPPMLNVTTKWCKVYKVDNGVETEVTAQQELTLGQSLTLVVKSLTNPTDSTDSTPVEDFVIAKDAYGNLYSDMDTSFRPGSIKETGSGTTAAVDVEPNKVPYEDVPVMYAKNTDVLADIQINGVSNPSGVVTFYKTADGNNAANTAKIYINSVTENITVNATARLKMKANYNFNNYTPYAGTAGGRRSCAMLSRIRITPSSGDTLSLYHGGNAARLYTGATCFYGINDETGVLTTKGTWAITQGHSIQRTMTFGSGSGDVPIDVKFFKCAFAFIGIFDHLDNTNPHVEINGETVISNEDLINAYYETPPYNSTYTPPTPSE